MNIHLRKFRELKNLILWKYRKNFMINFNRLMIILNKHLNKIGKNSYFLYERFYWAYKLYAQLCCLAYLLDNIHSDMTSKFRLKFC